ncbi:flavin-containing monooxygenase [Novosphingobium mangrovi (ex Huang et al. 2023)]|uniref:NAD(P)/FAD-dependent oxidoreductase n=1 Tax=Novosphingobium mangrovi (ex Huang et al. 2023) TaxID=2976432 RepID=A0ABT2I1C0_9SPHN|nr:NAD(P)/FAD-dependent oxidoreductase [Novosphingobium mangrovi (ex Huang et al. 2023)]MCT2398603.1 NAD(P)/FAD-dependent oxidoreductase [Novosphingobium mangrovi (ex Huang et al. 2023)]
MTIYNPTQCPSASEIDIPAMHAKYLEERDRRIKKNHNDQYISADGKYADIYEVDPYTPVAPRDPVTGETDVVILGAGYCGMMVAAQLKKAGIDDFYNVDHGGNFGGTWYWNRYPGIQCDNDSLVYMPLLEETGYMPSKKFADGYEIHDHCQMIADTFDLRKNALFHTLIKNLKWDPEINRWHVGTNRGDDIKARFVVLAMGPLNKPKLPGIPGLDKFKGKIFHTARWDYDYTGGEWRNPVLDKLGDKKVAIIGTGATAIQVVPYLARYAGHTYVVQRTPSTIDARNNRPIDPEWYASLKPGWQEERIRNFHHAAMERLAPGEPDMVEDIWTEISKNVNAELEAEGWPDITPEEYAARREVMDYRVMERLRNRCDIVQDKATAEALKPYYRYLCKRPASNDDFYPAFNQDNVELIDVAETRGLEQLTENGFIHDGIEYECDCIIMASGYEVTNDLDRRWGIDTIEGREGLSIYDYWRDGFQTFQGMMAHNFPNMFFTGFTQAGANASNSKTFIDQGFHIGYVASEAIKRGAAVIEPSQEAQDAYIKHLRSVAVDNSQFANECTPSYFNNEGDQKKKRSIFGEPWGEGYYAFEDMLATWRNEGNLRGLTLSQPESLEPAE